MSAVIGAVAFIATVVALVVTGNLWAAVMFLAWACIVFSLLQVKP